MEDTTAYPNPIISIHWFRQDLRLHDNSALLAAINGSDQFYPVFIFDGKVASTASTQYLRMRFLCECLEDLDQQLRDMGSRLYCFQGNAVDVLQQIIQDWKVTRISYQEEPEAIWKARDDQVVDMCQHFGVECISKIGHTLWNPQEIIRNNGGLPPLTFSVFGHVVETMGSPERPLGNPVLSGISTVVAEYSGCTDRYDIPGYDQLGFGKEASEPDQRINKWKGGEKEALNLFNIRLQEERLAFRSGQVLPNQYLPDLTAPPKSLSPYLKFGCLSVRKFYWMILDTYSQIASGAFSKEIKEGVVAQLMWREYFYTMSSANVNYGQIEGNPICLPIQWSHDEQKENQVEMGQTGYPFIDAIMNQLRCEGWVHHVGRHMLASYITRGDLWLSWEVGVRIFEKYLLDYDWSICAGNWMWASSSAFERALDCPKCFDPVKYGQRMDPHGEYVRRYVPALKKMPLKYLFQPWAAPEKIQNEAGCIVGRDYPVRLNDHRESSKENQKRMQAVRHKLSDLVMKHCAPSNEEEVRKFVWLPDATAGGGRCTGDMMCEGIAVV